MLAGGHERAFVSRVKFRVKRGVLGRAWRDYEGAAWIVSRVKFRS